MTSDEFSDFLKSIGGLENGIFTGREPIMNNFCSCDDGWLELIKNLIEELIAAGWDKHITDCKEKFGQLRFYISEGNEEIYKIISKYEKLSGETCEVCGTPGELRSINRWYTTLCNTHYKEILNEKS